MCDPVSMIVATAAIGGAQQIVGFVGQQQAYQANKTIANQQYANTANSLATQRAQISEQKSEDTVTALIEQAKDQGRISASASSMGMDAPTATREGNAAAFSAGRAIGVTGLNAQNATAQNIDELQGANIKRAADINKVTNPSPLSLVLGLGKTGIGAYGDYTKVTTPGGR